MSKLRSDALFVLIKSLKKSEKRYFKIAEARAGELKYLRLFELIDAQKEFDEGKILAAEPTFDPVQFSNLKAHLYSKLLKSLRDFSRKSVPGIEIRQLIDEAQVLLGKSLYRQCAKRLDKAEKLAAETDSHELQLEILKWKKQVLTYTVDFEDQQYVEEIVAKVSEVNTRINNINTFSNLQARLQSLYRKSGYIRNEDEHRKAAEIFAASVPAVDEATLSISERIHLYHLYIGYHFYVQDFEAGLEFAEKLVGLFRAQQALQLSKPESYIAGLNFLLIAQNKLRRINDFQNSSRELRNLNRVSGVMYTEHIRLKLFKYTFVHEFNGLFMTGEFDRGVALFDRLSSGLESFIAKLDAHSRVILYYKTACLYFGNGDYRNCLHWLNVIFNLREVDLREDIFGFARILNLICHFELGNAEQLPYYVRSTYRFMLKNKDMYQYQRYILNFLKSLQPRMTKAEMASRFETLHSRMLSLQSNPYESRAFVYFDMVAWLESRIEGRSMMEVIKQKALQHQPL